MQLSEMRVEIVVWADANYYHEQGPVDYDYKQAECLTVGHLLCEDDCTVTIAMDMVNTDTGTETRNIAVIPKAGIIARQRLTAACITCNGRGRVAPRANAPDETITCPTCNGRGL